MSTKSTVLDLVFAGSTHYMDIPTHNDPLAILIAEEEGHEVSSFTSQLDIIHATGVYDERQNRSRTR